MTTRIPTVAEMQSRHAAAMRDAWKAPPTAPAAAPLDALYDDGVRLDAPPLGTIPQVADLQARHAAAQRNAWKNAGDGADR